MWRGTLQRSLIDNEVESIQDTLYGRGCGTTLSPVRVIVFCEITLILLTLSTRTLQNFSLIWIKNYRIPILCHPHVMAETRHTKQWIIDVHCLAHLENP